MMQNLNQVISGQLVFIVYLRDIHLNFLQFFSSWSSYSCINIKAKKRQKDSKEIIYSSDVTQVSSM